MDTGAILRTVREIALDELDLEHEASTQRQLRAACCAPSTSLVVPASDMELSSETVLVERMLGGPTLAEAGPGIPGAVARTLVAAHVPAARAG